jgi:hypothetical protein
MRRSIRRCWSFAPGLRHDLLGEAAGNGVVLLCGQAAHIRRHHGQKLPHVIGIAPEELKRLVEDVMLGAAADQHGVQRPIERGLVGDAGREHGFRRGQRPFWAER